MRRRRICLRAAKGIIPLVLVGDGVGVRCPNSIKGSVATQRITCAYGVCRSAAVRYCVPACEMLTRRSNEAISGNSHTFAIRIACHRLLRHRARSTVGIINKRIVWIETHIPILIRIVRIHTELAIMSVC